jgi:hypothetical protein
MPIGHIISLHRAHNINGNVTALHRYTHRSTRKHHRNIVDLPPSALLVMLRDKFYVTFHFRLHELVSFLVIAISAHSPRRDRIEITEPHVQKGRIAISIALRRPPARGRSAHDVHPTGSSIAKELGDGMDELRGVFRVVKAKT